MPRIVRVLLLLPLLAWLACAQFPVIQSFSPASVKTNVGQFTLTLLGTGFTPQAVVHWSYHPVATTFVSSTRLEAVVPAQDTTNAAEVPVIVRQGTSMSVAVNFPVVAALRLYSVLPSTLPVGSPSTKLTVNGDGFSAITKVTLDGVVQPTWWATPGTLEATIDASLMTAEKVVKVGAVKGTEVAVPVELRVTPLENTFSILDSVQPSSTQAGTGDLAITIRGQRFSLTCFAYTFVAGQGYGTPIPTTFISSTEVRAVIPASRLAHAGVFGVGVQNGDFPGNTLPFTVTAIPNAPVITGFSPAKLNLATDTSLNVQGSGFASGAVVWFGPTAMPTTILSSTSLAVQIPQNPQPTPGLTQVTVLSGGVSSEPKPLEIISVSETFGPEKVEPERLPAGTAGAVVYINGRGLQSTDQLTWNGTPMPFTFESSSRLRLDVPASLLAVPGEVFIGYGRPPNPIGLYLLFEVTSATTATPFLKMVVPGAVPAGSGNTMINVFGVNFLKTAVVTVNGVPLPTIYISDGQLNTTIPAGMLSNPGTATVMVLQGDSRSVGHEFRVLGTTQGGGGGGGGSPALNSVMPASVVAGTGSFNVWANGSGFVSGATIAWNGSGLSTTFVSSSQLSAVVPASSITQAGTAQVTVNSAGAVLGPMTVTISTPSLPIQLTALQPASATAGSAAFTLTVTGSGFANGASVRWNGAALSTTFFSSGRLTAEVPASLVATAGTATVSVTSGGASSAALVFPITGGSGAMKLLTVSPASGPMGSLFLPLTLTGSGFDSSAVVLWNGTPLTTTYVSSGLLTTRAEAGQLSTSGVANITVRQAGLVTAPLTVTVLVPPRLASLEPEMAEAGTAELVLTARGSSFTAGSFLKWGAQRLETRWISPAELAASVPAELLSQPGWANVGVVTGEGLLAAALPFQVRYQSAPGLVWTEAGSGVELRLASPAPMELQAELELVGGDPYTQFWAGGTLGRWHLAAGQSSLLPGLQWGSTAGAQSIRLKSLSAGTVDVMPAGVVSLELAGEPGLPRLDGLRLDSANRLLEFDVVAPARAVDKALLEFEVEGATAGPALEVDLREAAAAWFASEEGTAAGAVAHLSVGLPAALEPAKVRKITARVVAGTAESAAAALVLAGETEHAPETQKKGNPRK